MGSSKRSSRSRSTPTRACALLFAFWALACNAPKAPASESAPSEKPADDKPADDKDKAAATPATTAQPAPSASSGDIPAPSDVAAAPADAEKTASGLASKVLEKGTGDTKPKPWDEVKVHYTGWT